MSEKTETRENSLVDRGGRSPVALGVLTLLLVTFYFVGNMVRESLSDSIFQFDFAIFNFITMGCGLLLGIGWLIWLCFFSGFPKILSYGLPLLIVIGFVGGAIVYRPVFGGGMALKRLEPRFWKWRELGAAEGDLEVDLGEDQPSGFWQYLGPNRNGILDASQLNVANFDRIEKLWSQPIGEGWSGFVARIGFAYTMEQRDDQESVVCYQIATGQVAWGKSHKRRHDDPLGGVGPRATPTLYGDKLYAVGANGMLVCLDASTGYKFWSQDLNPILGISLTESVDSKGLTFQVDNSKVIWGRAGSPLVVDNLVVVPGGGAKDGEQSSLVAFDRETGEVAWHGGSDGIGYSSPSLLELDGVRQIVTVNEGSVSGHRIEDGKTLWTYERSGNSDADANTSQAIPVATNRLLLSKGYGMGGELIELTNNEASEEELAAGEKQAFEVTSVWTSPRVLKTKLTNSIAYQGHAYAISDGILECVNLANGERVWKKGRFGHGQCLIVDGHLIIHSEDGNLHLVKASPEGYQNLGSIKTIDGICWNTICIVDGHILVRSDIEAACYRIPNGQ